MKILDDGVRQSVSVSLACPYQIPKAQRQAVTALLRQLWDASQDPLRASLERRTCLLMFVLAPRCYWPCPRKQPRLKLAPHSRPRVVRDCMHQFTKESGWGFSLRSWACIQTALLIYQKPGLTTLARLQNLNSRIQHSQLSRVWKTDMVVGNTWHFPCHPVLFA